VKRQVGGRTAVRPYDKSFVWLVKSHLWDNLSFPDDLDWLDNPAGKDSCRRA